MSSPRAPPPQPVGPCKAPVIKTTKKAMDWLQQQLARHYSHGGAMFLNHVLRSKEKKHDYYSSWLKRIPKNTSMLLLTC